MSVVRIGTCSWKFPSWTGLVYSKAKGINYLAEYSRRYDTVEIDQWFWSLFAPNQLVLPDPVTVAEYLAAVPPRFRFSIKAPNAISLTHPYKKRGTADPEPNPHFLSPELYQRFLERIEPMRQQTAAVILQFEYLNRNKMASLQEFLKRLDAFLDQIDSRWPLVIETRNPNYLKPDLFALLAKRRVGFGYCHGYYMPPMQAVYREHFAERTPRNPAVVRLLGPDRTGIEEETGKRWNRIVASKDDELPEIAATITAMLEREVDVIVNVNNHYEGSAPLTIEKLERMIDDRFR